MLYKGLYEKVISLGLEKELIHSDQLVQTASIDAAEAAKILSKYVAEVVEIQLQQMQDNGGDVKDQIKLTNRLLRSISEQGTEDENPAFVAEKAEQLLALLDRKNNIQTVNGKPMLVRPETSIVQTSRPDQKLDVFFVTLNKADKDYSPTTMYQDYSINEYLFHWQSQSTTSEQSPTAQRYIHHKEMGTRILLFVREFKKDLISGGAQAYTFLGTANY